ISDRNPDAPVHPKTGRPLISYTKHQIRYIFASKLRLGANFKNLNFAPKILTFVLVDSASVANTPIPSVVPIWRRLRNRRRKKKGKALDSENPRRRADFAERRARTARRRARLVATSARSKLMTATAADVVAFRRRRRQRPHSNDYR